MQWAINIVGGGLGGGGKVEHDVVTGLTIRNQSTTNVYYNKHEQIRATCENEAALIDSEKLL